MINKKSNKEIEVKILNINKKIIISKLRKLGAKKVFEGKIEANVYDFSKKSLTKSDSFLRTRKLGDDSFITFKRKINNNKARVREEIELQISDFDNMNLILENLGLIKLKTYRKYRTSYVLNSICFDIDEYKGLPTYMEVEAPNLKKLNEGVKLIGYTKKDMFKGSMKEVMKMYGLKHD